MILKTSEKSVIDLFGGEAGEVTDDFTEQPYAGDAVKEAVMPGSGFSPAPARQEFFRSSLSPAGSEGCG